MASLFPKFRGLLHAIADCGRPMEPGEVSTREMLARELPAEQLTIVTSSPTDAWRLLQDRKADSKARWGTLMACDHLWKMYDNPEFLDDVIKLVDCDEELRASAIGILHERLCGTRNLRAAKALASVVLDDTSSVTVRYQAYAALWSVCEPRKHDGEVYSLVIEAIERELKNQPFGPELLDKIDWNIVKHYA